MADIKYKCESCGCEFNGDEYISQCPDCDGDEFMVLQSSSIIDRIKSFFQDNKIVSLIIAGLIFFGLLLALKNCNANKSETTTNADNIILKLKSKDNFIQLVFKNKETNKEITYTDAKLIIAQARFRAVNHRGEGLKIEKGKIYPCGNGRVQITWNSDFYKSKTKKWIKKEKNITFNLKNKAKIHAKAVCKVQPDIKLIKKNCLLQLTSNYDNLYPKDVLMVSVTGKNGRYTTKRNYTYNSSSNKNYNVYCFYQGSIDTIAIQGGKGKVTCCKTIDKNKLRVEILKLCNQYGNNPSSNINTAYAIKKLISTYNLKVKYKGRIKDMNEIINTFKVAHDDDNTRYSAKVQLKGSGCANISGTITFSKK